MDASTLRFIMELANLLGKAPCIPVIKAPNISPSVFCPQNLPSGTRHPPRGASCQPATALPAAVGRPASITVPRKECTYRRLIQSSLGTRNLYKVCYSNLLEKEQYLNDEIGTNQFAKLTPISGGVMLKACFCCRIYIDLLPSWLHSILASMWTILQRHVMT